MKEDLTQRDFDGADWGGRRLRNVLARHSFAVGLSLRLGLAYLLPRLLDANEGGSTGIVPGVDYTDVDYRVYQDAAECVRRGGSPYDRHTYRYTPFLAVLVAHLPHRPRESARYLFCIADAICGYILLNLRTKHRRRQRRRHVGTDTSPSTPAATTCDDNADSLLVDAMWWLYNPFPMNICTRGSAEALVLLPVLMTVRVLSNFCEQEEEENNDDNSLAARQRNKRTVRQWFTAAAAGLWHGIAIHVKIYPIIYTLSFAACLSSSLDSTMPRDPAGASSSHNHVTAKRRGIARTTINLLVHWLLRLLSPLPILFGTVTLLTFASLTYASYAMYGFQSLQEGLLYHLSRVDHRHNYSIFWYWIYLSRARAAETAVSLAATATDSFHPPHDGVALASSSFGVLGRLLLLPQAALLLYVSLGVAPKRLNLALFVQTFAFVALNKVVTAQYFTWYLVLLPLCSGEIEWSRPRLQASLAILGWSVAAWLGTAYCLEMLGMAVHRTVFAASILFFAANINLLGALLSAASLPSSSHNDQRVPSRVIGGIKND